MTPVQETKSGDDFLKAMQRLNTCDLDTPTTATKSEVDSTTAQASPEDPDTKQKKEKTAKQKAAHARYMKYWRSVHEGRDIKQHYTTRISWTVHACRC